MKTFKVFSSIFFMLLFPFISGGVWGQILTFDFAGLVGDEATANSNFNNVGLASSTISRGAGLTTSPNADRFNATGWAVTSIANAVSGNDYMEFTITPNSGQQFSVSSIVIQLQRSATGHTAIALRNSVDSYVSNLDGQKAVTDNTLTQTFTFTFAQLNSTTAVTYRLYGFAESGTGTGGPGDGTGNDIVVNGSVTPVATNPTITSPTVSSITESSAVLGANITSNGGSTITERGTVYSTSSPVTTVNNALAEGGVTTGVFTQSRTGLSAQTQYYFAGYATNSTGTALSTEGNFRTLSNPPTSQASGLSATVSSASQINLSIANAAGFPSSGATQGGYLLIYSTGTPTLGSSNGQAPNASVGTIFSTPAAVLSSATPSTSINVTGLSSSTAYNFTIIPYTWDGTNSATYNYLVTNAVTVSATTNAGLPTLISPTATSITSTSATLGANVTSNGGSNLTARGTVYSTSSPVSSGNNALAEGGASTGVFTQNRTSLNPQTLYYFAGYATSSAGTSLSAEGSFRTLSEAPTSQVSSINATASSPSEIGLSIGGANFPNSGATNAGYVIIYSTGTPTFASSNGQAPSAGVGTIFSTTSTVLPLNPATTINITGLLSSTTYNLLVIPYTWDGVNASTYNYLTSGAQTVTQVTPAATYTWIGSNNGSWSNAANWSPNRITPSSTDNIVFNGGNTLTITGIITQSIASLSVLGSSTKITLTAQSSSILSIGNASGVDLNVASGCELNLSSSSAITIVTIAGATGSINGSMKFTNAAHSLVPADANAVVFNNGSSFIAGDLTSTGFSGNPFGSNSGIVYNGVVFSSGATFLQYEGSNPFAITQPNSRVQFQAGSNFIFSVANTGSPSLSGRTYGNLEINTTSNGLSSQTGSSPLVINGNLTLISSSAAVNFNLTGGISISGNINVSNGQNLGFSPGSAGTITFNGSSQQTISGAGNITFGSNTTIQINNPSEVQINMDLIISGNLTINNLGVLNIQNNKKLTLTGTLTNNGTLTLENGATFVQGPSSTIASGTTGTYNVKQTVTGAGGAGVAPTGRFWYMGVPLNSLTRGAAFGTAGTDNRLWSWSESSQAWSSQLPDNTVLAPTTGYVFRTSAASTTLNFSGTSLYSSNVSLTGLTNSGGAFDGCHLLSNPYTAYLDWEQIVDPLNTGTSNLSSTYCVRTYNGTSMVYDTYNANGDVAVNPSGVAMTRYIAPMQAFWIIVNPSTTGSISMTKSMLSHQSGAVGLKDITSFPAFARLNLVSGSFIDQVVVYTDVNATAEFDDYDSKKFFLPNMPQVYCPVGDKKTVINALKQGKAQTSAPLTVELPSTQVYKFEMAESFVENGLVILEDKQEGIFQDMGVNPIYEFYGNSGVIADRFVLHFHLPNGTNNGGQPGNGGEAGIEDLTSGQIAVIANHDGAVNVVLSADLTTSGDIQIYDEAGRLVAQKAITSAQTSLQLNNGIGVYFVRVQTPMKTEMKKVMVY